MNRDVLSRFPLPQVQAAKAPAFSSIAFGSRFDLTVDVTGQIRSAKAVVDVHHTHTTGTAVEHR